MPVFSDKNFVNDTASGVAVVKFFSLWNYDSRTLEDPFKEISEEFKGKAKFLESDVNGNPDLAKKYRVTTIPSIMVFIDGKPIAKIERVHSKRFLKEQLEKFAGR